ncbi:fimbrial protein [Providencia stuartii]|uniref:Fimbrial-type adhesion domain-containing protein n=1 Tax=Providencia stuartii TaxID=588 RepID=A0A1S1HPP7_PROST|nr:MULTISPECIES: fimbrial protein [Providencia]ELR5300861.1 fimbrial protein [Providencia stuartii]MDW7589819.1 fimbrial protein [Providencia sp. 2023EL-00965]OHT22330.1 hypothetical protein A3Q29_10945 [Providencia stuartii]
MRKLIITLLVILFSIEIQAVTCLSGCNDVTATLTTSLKAGENKVGAIYSSSPVKLNAYTMTVNQNNEGGYLNIWFVFAGGAVPVSGTKPQSWVFHPINDYISVGIKFSDGCSIAYVPFNIQNLYPGSCVIYSYSPNTFTWWPETTYDTAIRIDKPLVGGTYRTNILVGERGVCSSNTQTCQAKTLTLFHLYLNLNITVVESCSFNGGQVIDVDFGNISSSEFKNAGEKPNGVNEIVRTINIQCDNVGAGSAMTLRLQADNVSGNAVVSNNSDVGFVVANSDGNPLIPNNTSSYIPFTLDSAQSAIATLRIYPISITGKQPVEGTVTSQAYIRVDFP